jgi:hypothetical protein
LPTDERTLPQALKEAGYQTSMVGKWHLGHADKKYWPQNRGFDPFYGNLVGEVDYFTKMRGGIVDWQRDGKFIQPPHQPSNAVIPPIPAGEVLDACLNRGGRPKSNPGL